VLKTGVCDLTGGHRAPTNQGEKNGT